MWILIICALLALAVLAVLLSLMVDIPSFETYWKMRQIQGPKGWPFIGIGLDLISLGYSEVFPYMKSIIDDYPGVVKAWVLGTPMVFVSNPEDVEVVMSSVNHIKKGVEYTFLLSWLNEGLLTSSGDKWKSRRKLLTPSFHFKILENNLSTLNKNSRLLVRNFLETAEPIDVHSLVSLCTLDVICETAMGTTVNAQNKEGKDYIRSVKKVSEGIVFRILNLYLKDWMFSLMPIGASYNKCVKQLHDYTEKIIKERKEVYKRSKEETILEETTGKRRHAFLDMLIEMESTHSSIRSDLDIREEVDTFMFEGHDTTSSALTFAIFLLGLHKDVQERAYQEQYEIFGNSDREVTNNDLKEMSYLTKVIKETLRLFPSVPYMSRKIQQDINTKDSLIPKGANVLIIPYFLHRSEEYYPNPDVFDPERFEPEEASKRHPFSYIPFSAGPRNCIGQKFAMMELKVILSTVLRFCTLDSVTKYEELVLIPLVILRNMTPVIVNIKKRNLQHES